MIIFRTETCSHTLSDLQCGRQYIYHCVKSVIYHTYMYLLHYSVGVSTSSSNTMSFLSYFISF